MALGGFGPLASAPLADDVASSGLISASINVAFTTSGTATTGGPISASINVAFTTSGAMQAAAKASINVAFTTSGTVTGAGALSGVISPAFETAGTMGGTGAMASAISVAFSTSGMAEVGVGPVSTPIIRGPGLYMIGEAWTCSTGTWMSANPLTFTYQWRRAASSITGATSNAYTLKLADSAAAVDCLVTATEAITGHFAQQDSNDITVETDSYLLRSRYRKVTGMRGGKLVMQWTAE